MKLSPESTEPECHVLFDSSFHRRTLTLFEVDNVSEKLTITIFGLIDSYLKCSVAMQFPFFLLTF